MLLPSIEIGKLFLSEFNLFHPCYKKKGRVIQVSECNNCCLKLIVWIFLCNIMTHLSSGESSKPTSSQKAHLLVEFEETNRSLAQKEEDMRQLVERMQRLEDT